MGAPFVLAMLWMAPAAFGHAAFLSAQPAPGARLDASPRQIVLRFTEPLNRRLTRVTLHAARTGDDMPAATETTSSSVLSLRPLQELRAGAYRVAWHTVSTEDGHALEGTFSFGVRAAAVGSVHDVEQSPLARSGWLRITLRALLYVTVLLACAALLIPAFLRRTQPSWLAPSGLEPSLAAPALLRDQRLRGDLPWLAAAAVVAATLAEAADAAGGLSAGGVRDFVFGVGTGTGRIVAVAMLVVAAVTAQRRRGWAALAATLALGGVALSGHAASASPRALAILDDWLHLLAGAVWLGGIGVLTLVWGPVLRHGDARARREVARSVLPSFGRVALPAFGVVVATGAISLVLQLHTLGDLVDTAYGNVLLVKIGLVGAIAAMSFMHVYRLRPRLLARDAEPTAHQERRHWRLLRTEPVVAIGVAAAVGVLVAFPLPPRQLGEADEARAAVAPCDPCPLPAARANELGVAGRAGTQLVAAWIRRDGDMLLGTVRVLDSGGKPSRAPVKVLAAGSTSCGPGCRRFQSPRIARLRVAVHDRGRWWVASLPSRWRSSRTAEARRLLRRAQSTMRRLRSARQVEVVSSVPGISARTAYQLQAPDRMALQTSSGTRTVVIGERQWLRAPGIPWSRRQYGSGIPFSTRSWYRWTTYAQAVRMLDRRMRDGRPVVELALTDQATPVWFRLLIDERSGRILREQMTATAHFARTRFFAFDRPVEVRRPHDAS